MEINLMDVNKFVDVNSLKEVTNPIFLDYNKSPTYDGLLSTEIFGNSTRQRTITFAYISLGGYYLQPVIYKNIKRMDRRIDDIILGKVKFRIEKDGSLVQDEEKGQTGLDFLYKNWEKIKYKKNESSSHNDRVDLLSLYKKNEIFTDKWLVCPAMYRDINLQNIDTRKIGADTVNGLYSKLIRLASMLKTDSTFISVMNNTKFNIQLTLVEIYDYFKKSIEKKNGLIRKSLLGKNVDYGVRSVITSSSYNTNSYKDTDVDFYHAGVPLAMCCALFTPFILHWVRNFFQRELEFLSTRYLKIENKKVDFIPLKDPLSFYNDNMLKKMLDIFVHSFSARFQKIEIPHENMDKKKYYMRFIGQEKHKELTSNDPLSSYLLSSDLLDENKDVNDPINRYFTLTDLFYLAATNVCKDKMIYITRYPMTDTMGSFPIGINVLSTTNTIDVSLNGVHYPKYPLVDLSLNPSDVATQFVDTLRFQHVYLKVMVGDYDGDVVSIKGVYSQSANKEAEKIMRSKINVLNIAGQNIRTTTQESIQTLYSLTKWE